MEPIFVKVDEHPDGLPNRKDSEQSDSKQSVLLLHEIGLDSLYEPTTTLKLIDVVV